MLPEFPRLHAEFDKAITRYMRDAARNYDTVFAEVPSHHVFEGDQLSMHRADGTGETNKFFEAKSELNIPFSEMIDFELEDVLKHFSKTMEELAAQKAKHFFETISAAVDKVGNTVDAKGQPLDAKLYLDTLEKLWIEFLPDGKPRLPTLVAPPSARSKAEEMYKQLQTNPEYRNRFKKILEAKREEWRAREADRELVG